MGGVVEFFEEVHRVDVLSRCLSPLGLCLIQLHSPLTRQAMVNLSPHYMEDGRVIIVQEHDSVINLRSCPFTRTCWVMFLAFPLDFQTREIVSQAVGHFGTVVTWTTNSRCRYRILLRCKVTWLAGFPEVC
jgi:hypothetical protein